MPASAWISRELHRTEIPMKTAPVAVALVGLAAFAACEPGAAMAPLDPVLPYPPPQGCAQGSRQGLFDRSKFPAIAACAGSWVGSVDHARGLCSRGWHVCTGREPAVRAITVDDAYGLQGCFALDAAQDDGDCHPGCLASVAAGVDTAPNIDMAGFGAGCARGRNGQSCISGSHIEMTESSGTGCNFRPGWTGVVCCNGEYDASEPPRIPDSSDASVEPPAAPPYVL